MIMLESAQDCAKVDRVRAASVTSSEIVAEVVNVKPEPHIYHEEEPQLGASDEDYIYCNITKSEYELQACYWDEPQNGNCNDECDFNDEVVKEDGSEEEKDVVEGDAESALQLIEDFVVDSEEDEEEDNNAESSGCENSVLKFESVDPTKIDVENRTLEENPHEILKKKRNLLQSYLIRVCPVCGTDFENLSTWTDHMNGVHNYSSRKHYSTHYSYTKSGKAKCNSCKIIFNGSLNSLKSHILMHLPHKNIFKCKLCLESKSQVRSIIKHIEKQHFDVVGAAVAALMENGLSKNCPFCGQDVGCYLHEQSLHIQTQHERLFNHKMLYVCPACGVSYATKNSWNEHLDREHKYNSISGLSFELLDQHNPFAKNHMKYRCMTCKAIYSSKTPLCLLYKHALTHLPFKVFKCTYCDYDHSKKLHVITHVCKQLLAALKKNPQLGAKAFTKARQNGQRILYTNERLYVCPSCGEQFGEVTLWALHLTQAHNFDKMEFLNVKITLAADCSPKYNCTICNKYFIKANSHNMRAHAFRHMAHKIYKCKICYLSFSSKPLCSCKITNVVREYRTTVSLEHQHIIYVCPQCGEDFSTEQRWESHLVKEHNLREPIGLNFSKLSYGSDTISIYKCSVCDELVKTSASLYQALFNHATMKHLPFKCYKCRACGEMCTIKEDILIHVDNCRVSKEFSKNVEDTSSAFSNIAKCECYICGYLSDKIKDVILHMGNVHNINVGRVLCNYKWSCTICALKYDSQEDILRHIENKHTGAQLELPHEMQYKCRNCDMRFSTSVYAKQHAAKCSSAMKSLLGPLKRKRKYFLNDTSLSEGHKERKKSKESKPETDPPCDPLHLDSSNVQKISQTTMATCSEETIALDQYEELISYACPECNLPLATKEAWHTHINKHHNFFSENQLKIAPIAGVKQKWLCEECGVKVHGSLLHCQRHKLTHLPYSAFICCICKHRSKTPNVLIYHIKRMHFTSGSFKCIFCPLIFETTYKRFIHIKAEHSTAEWPENVCRICMQFVERRFNLEQHMKTHDFDRMKYACGYCNRKYFSLAERKKHWLRNHPQEYSTNHAVQQAKKRKTTKK